MIGLAFGIGVFILCAFLISIIALCEHKNIVPIIVFVLMFLGCGASLCFMIKDKYPTAIEVYQGKTTLEITYQDSVAVDSVVVYKK